MSGREDVNQSILDEEYWKYNPPEFDEEPEIREIEGFPGYFIDSYGGVSRFCDGEFKPLKPWIHKNGYLAIDLVDEYGNRKKDYIHRLLAKAFIDNPNNEAYVRHYDDNKLNNDLRNLRWGSPQENHDDMVRNGNEFRKGIYCYETDTIYYSGAEAARQLGCSKSAVTLAAKGKNGTAGGYHVCYESDIEEKMENLEEWLQPRTWTKPLYAKNLSTGEELHFDSRNEAASYIGIPECGISSVITGHISQTHGWIFWED